MSAKTFFKKLIANEKNRKPDYVLPIQMFVVAGLLMLVYIVPKAKLILVDTIWGVAIIITILFATYAFSDIRKQRKGWIAK